MLTRATVCGTGKHPNMNVKDTDSIGTIVVYILLPGPTLYSITISITSISSNLDSLITDGSQMHPTCGLHLRLGYPLDLLRHGA